MAVYCGIDLSAKEAVFYAVDEKGSEVFMEKLKVSDADDAKQLILFQNQAFQLLNSSITALAVSKRMGKGKFAASPQSFKLEAALQLLFPNLQLISPQTVKAFLKKHPNTGKAKFSYAEKAFDLAFYLSTSR